MTSARTYITNVSLPPLDAEIIPKNVAGRDLNDTWRHVVRRVMTDTLTSHVGCDLMIELYEC